MPPAIVKKLNTAINEVLADPKVKKQFESMGSEPSIKTPDEFGAQIKAGTPQYAMYGFAIFYAVCLVLNWWFYLRGNAYVKNP